MAIAEWLTATEALTQLGVRPQTLYAYVSRGRLEARPDVEDSRKSLYRADDVARLRNRKARGRKAALVAEDAIAWGEPVLASAITTVAGGRLYYRGRDAIELARTETLESVARWLRGHEGPSLRVRMTPPGPPPADATARAFAMLAAQAAIQPPARGRAPKLLAAEAGGLLDALADAVAGVETETGTLHTPPIHLRLARAWNCDEVGADLIRGALVLLADHELNASTFAARVAASTGASPAASALAGLAALSGPLHGAMGARVQAFVDEAGRVGAENAVAARLAHGLPIPGLGHPLYPSGDPRARALLERFNPPPEFEAVRLAAEAQTGEIANVDYALTALTVGLKLPAPDRPPDPSAGAIYRPASRLSHFVGVDPGGSRQSATAVLIQIEAPSGFYASMDYAADQIDTDDAKPVDAALIERRASPRRKTRFKATIVHGEERLTASCIVRDLSETGARLKLDLADELPTRFHLIWVADRAVLEVEAVWRSNGEMGVKFLSKHNTQGRLSSELAAICRAWEQHDRAKV
jgi:citrate synthase